MKKLKILFILQDLLYVFSVGSLPMIEGYSSIILRVEIEEISMITNAHNARKS